MYMLTTHWSNETCHPPVSWLAIPEIASKSAYRPAAAVRCPFHVWLPVVIAVWSWPALGHGYVGSNESKEVDWTSTSMSELAGKRPLTSPLATWEVIWLFVTPGKRVRLKFVVRRLENVRTAEMVGSKWELRPKREAYTPRRSPPCVIASSRPSSVIWGSWQLEKSQWREEEAICIVQAYVVPINPGPTVVVQGLSGLEDACH